MMRYTKTASFAALLLIALVVGVWFFRSPGHHRVAFSPVAPQTAPDSTHAQQVAPTNAPPRTASSSTNRLSELRRQFKPELKLVGTPVAGELPVALEGYRIYTGQQPRFVFNPLTADDSIYVVQFTGPIQNDWKKRLQSVGGRIHGYLPHHALSVEMNPRSIKRLINDTFVRSVFPLLPEYKLQPFLAYLSTLDDSEIPDDITITLSLNDPQDLDGVTHDISGQGFEVIAQGAGTRWGWVRARGPRALVRELAAINDVQWIEEYVAPRLVNDQSVMGKNMNVTNIWNARGLTGAGQVIGHADTGLDVGNTNTIHPDFAGRIAAAFDLGRAGRWDDPDGHGTHTAGSILGNGSMSTGQFRGVAYDAQLVHQSVLDAGGGLGGLPFDLNDLYRQAYTNRARIHANSWGSSTYGFYNTDSRQTDEFMWDHPEMLVVFAAGNDGYDSGNGIIDGDSIGAPATAKNILTVGAAESGRAPGSGGLSSRTYGSLWPWDYWQPPIYDDYVSQPYDLTNQGMAAFSSRGPADDGRIKPEVVAPGTDIISTRSKQPGAGTLWGAHPNANYAFSGGTSMSTPLAAGAAALVRQYFDVYKQYPNPSAALVKAAMMHGARTMTPGQYGTNQFQEIPALRPNSVEGFGHVDVERTLFPSDATWFYSDEKTGLASPGDFATHVFYANTGTVNITINYTDFPALAGSGIKLVNDLDLVVGEQSLRDRINPFEHISMNVSTPGAFTARVEAINIPNGPQPYAIIISGPVIDAPRIIHEPFPNQFETNAPYTVTARVIAANPLATNAVSLHWRVAPAANFTRVVMMRTTNDMYVGTIPAQVNPSVISYYLSASNAVFVVNEPAGAPATSHTFRVTRSYNLVVSGAPASIYSVEPPYGTNRIAEGNSVQLRAPAFTNITPAVRVAVSGWTGTGSVPATGNTNRVLVLMTNDASITWNWVTQNALTQTSSVEGAVAAISWHDAWALASTIAAPAAWTNGDGIFGLAGWSIDGVRHPNNSAAAENPATGIVMFGPRTGEAVYVPIEQDNNSNALPDWWEQFYFGTNTAIANMDSDDDGFTNIKEFQDRTHPRDASSTPQAPAIAHVPLANPQSAPAPWNLRAAAFDNYAVSNVLLYWQRNAGAWTSVVMSAGTSNEFAATIPAPGTNGNSFAYRIEAIDFAGLKAVTGPYSFGVAYPLMNAQPERFGVIDVLAGATTNLVVAITNGGLGALAWTLSRALFYDHVEAGTNTWVHTGQNDVWNINTGRFASARHAWHFGRGPGGTYPDSAHAWLDMEPVHVHAPARLVFDHWAKMEYDTDQMDDHYWDGGVVEVSVDGGTNYMMIHPEGGYPHRITDNPASPFAPDTPCYGETEGWEEAAFDISAFTGETVHVRFRFGADAYVTEEGWYIDNVRIEYHNDAAWSWLSATPGGFVAPQKTSNTVVAMTSASLNLGERRTGVLVLEGNDPVRAGPVLIPVGIHNASREIVVTASDMGRVSPTGAVRMRYGDGLVVSATADTFFVISGVYTNGFIMPGHEGQTAATISWLNIQTNGALHVEFADDMILGRVPASWLYANGFTNGSFSAEAGTDHDGDGMLTWQEYMAVTDPRTSTSVAVKIISIAPGISNNLVEWISFTNTNRRYTIAGSINLTAGFSPIATNLPGTPPVNVFTNQPDQPFQIYRITTHQN